MSSKNQINDIQESSFRILIKSREGNEVEHIFRLSSKKEAQDYVNMEKKAWSKEIASEGKKRQDVVSWKIVDSLESPTHSFSKGKLIPNAYYKDYLLYLKKLREDLDIQEDEWGGGFQTFADAHREVQAGLKGDMQRERAKILKLVVQVIRGEITKQKFKKLTGKSYDDLMDAKYRGNWYVNQVKRMSKKALAPVNPAAPASTVSNSYEPDGGDIQESSFAILIKSREGNEVTDRPRLSSKKEAQDYVNMVKKAVAKRVASEGKKPQDVVSWKIVDSLESPTHSFSKGKLIPNARYKDYLLYLKKLREDLDIQEKVDIDGRTRAYRETVMRLESARKLREQRAKAMQENRFGGLYDDGSGRGAVVPAPIDINFHEAMRVVEKYRSLREKKKTLMGAPKEDIDAAVLMKGDKFSMSETELSPKQKEFRTFFKKALTKFGKSSPAKMDDAEKKKFFNWIEKNWKG